ncbi:DUF7521 family protein [Haloarcula salinisoli]|uniref:Uncharacterized protein n=1 Tax=Haloarcula salinisoli TaxID=2487746 RepID=A0A8J7YJD4_9EURY|nr:hypothetical protein [Halomicroarcula salinisoli]MBX0287714.1 hypothetical protein [Halomicroarcula salinisoli]MBX0304638.1 hypothetical protein [Halomicroarcula salinisoli]
MVEPQAIAEVVSVLELLVGLAITGLAFQGYRRNRSRAMLFLGGGIATMTVVSLVVIVVVAFFSSASARMVGLASSLTNLVGMCLILYAIVLARRE